MRYILIILVFLSVGANAQMVIKAHANYRPYAAAVPFVGLLDDYPNAAAAYSLRKLDKDYTGSAIRVRRSNDNAESDIGFTSSGDLDTAALKTFVGANNGLIVTWYNQGDSTSVDFTQATALNQPRIINAGTVERVNGKVAVFFDGSNDAMSVNSLTKFNFLHKAGESFVFFVTQPSVLSAGHYLIGTARNAGERGIQYLYSGTTILHNVYAAGSVTVISNQTASSYVATNTQYLISFYSNTSAATASARSTIEKNNGNAVTNNAATGTASTSDASRNIQLGQAANGGSFLNGYIQEFVIWNLGQTSNKTGIATNVNTYYSIY